MKRKELKFIDLFAGLGGIRLGFEQAASELGISTECVFTSEIKEHAIKSLTSNFNHKNIAGDITKIEADILPDFDYLLAGFPCQAFSVAGKQKGFVDTRGTLFFDIERILKAKKPIGFILENVEGLVKHDRENKNDNIGRTLKTIVDSLSKDYKVTYRVLDSKDFGVPQSRKRIFIIGSLNKHITLDNFEVVNKNINEILESKVEVLNTEFTKKILKHYKPEMLYGKFIKDKRGGDNNIHSWDISAKGEVNTEEKRLLNMLFKERRKKHWAEKIGIEWMDGMPLTKEQIETFYNNKQLPKMLDNLVKKGYISFEHPKKKIVSKASTGQNKVYERVPDITKSKGYNIVSGKLSYPFSHFLNPNDIAPTLVAMDMDTIGVIDGKGIRNLTIREGLRLFGYPETYSLDMFEVNKTEIRKAYDLLGNSVCVPVVKAVSLRVLKNNNL
jgi:DNA (cytosine-5)-methyltransferase 1